MSENRQANGFTLHSTRVRIMIRVRGKIRQRARSILGWGMGHGARGIGHSGCSDFPQSFELLRMRDRQKHGYAVGSRGYAVGSRG